MRFMRIFAFLMFLVPFASFGAGNEFMVAAQLLSAAKNADIQQVQALINNGANVNYVDSTGLSIVCTALMNNDVRAAQISQMYGADASKCDRQIKNYKSKNKPTGSGGLFGGLSSAQSITLAAAGAAVIVGGLFLLTDWFDPGNKNKSSSSGGSHGNGGGGGSSSGPSTAFTLPDGPASLEDGYNYTTALDFYSPSDTTSIYYENFNLMTNGYKQNYLLMMHGYSPLARGYMGMSTLRNQSTNAPLSLAGNNLGTEPVLGGSPITVALITANGINAVDDTSLADKLMPWTTLNDNGTVVNPASNSMISSKYYNNKIIPGTDTASLDDDTTEEDSSLVGLFDLSGAGTAIHNTSASDLDNLLAKVVAGSITTGEEADFMGFMPNGQLMIFRTGGGSAFTTLTPTDAGTYTLDSQGVLTTLTISNIASGDDLTVALDGTNVSATNGDDAYIGYIGGDNLLYLDTNGDGVVDVAYSMTLETDSTTNGVLKLAKKLGTTNYYNYEALRNALMLYGAVDSVSGGRSRPSIIANASVIAPLHATTTATIDDILSLGTSNYRDGFAILVNNYYSANTDGNATSYPSSASTFFFTNLGSTYSPIVLFSTGAVETDSSYSGWAHNATFENAAPLVYDNLEHLFASIVAVGQKGDGTKGTTNISGYSPRNKYILSQWPDPANTEGGENNKYYRARMCGIAGTGANGIDPWCFAAAGPTDELAVAAAAGAFGAVKSAFSYLTNQQIFALVALTADGAYLGSNDAGNAFTVESLTTYLQGLYELPNEYQYRVNAGTMTYLDAFKEVFGYGLINVERATTPGKSIHYYNGTNIVSTAGNAYWRAASNTAFRASSAFGARDATLRTAAFDVLTSIDGELSLPRIWTNEFAIGTNSRRGLYMGDVLGELRTRNDDESHVQIGQMGFSLTRSAREYNDNMGGLDSMKLDWQTGNWNFAGGYQRYFTDGASRFAGMNNPILGLASNAVVSDAKYDFGKWSFGARAFSGAITDETLLEHDPTVASMYEPARLGLVHGAGANVAWCGERFGFNTTIGTANETNTVLGAYTDGLLNMGAGRTIYVDNEISFRPIDKLKLTARATFARTTTDGAGNLVLGVSAIESNAFAIGAELGNFRFSVAQPLAVRHGALKYAYADYDIVDADDGNYALNIADTHIAEIDLSADKRELRFTGEYRHNFGEFTDGALGFIYRVNPNNTDEFGNESIFMLKMTHRVGI